MSASSAGNTVLVTGGAGFIGSSLCKRLIDDGHGVVCVDNLSTGRFANIQDLLESSRFRFVQHDIAAPIEIQANEIYNLACPASPRQYQEDPVKTVRSNVLGSINMLDLAKRCRARILQASTSEVYGDPHSHPQPESYWGNVNPVGPRSCYDEGKRCAETLFTDYHRQYGVDTRIVRIFNTYGPRLLPDDGRVISTFICQALANQPITIFGTGLQTRSFCFVDDTVEALVRMMKHPSINGPVNVGCDAEINMIELASIILRLTGSRSQILHEALPRDDPGRRQPDISRARELLQWEPETALVDGLRATIEYFRESKDVGRGAARYEAGELRPDAPVALST
jgi:UDP-glucuronate decarboxylase